MKVEIMKYWFIWFLLGLTTIGVTMSQISYQGSYHAQEGNPGGLNLEPDYEVSGWNSVFAGGLMSNQWSGSIQLPFSFNFYGSSFQSFQISGNGVLTFSSNPGTVPGDNVALPASALPNYSIAAFWEAFSLFPPISVSDEVMTKTFGSQPNRQFWIRWSSYEWGPSSFAYISIVLEEGTDNIYIVDHYSNPGSAGNITSTVGVQENNQSAVMAAGPNTPLAIGGSSYFDNSFFQFEPFQIPPEDLKITSIITPVNEDCGLGQEDVGFRVTNVGQLPTGNFQAFFSLDGNLVAGELVTSSIHPGDTIDYIFSASADISAVGQHELLIWVSSQADENPLNDSANLAIRNIREISDFPYVEDFETSSHGWESGGSINSWEWGTPINSTILGASSGIKAWITNATGNYLPFESSFVLSPCLNLSLAPSNSWLGLSIWWETETLWDGASIQVSSDEGETWQQLGNMSENWFNSPFIASLPGGSGEGWSGSSGGWARVYLPLDQQLLTEPKVRFRISFASNGGQQMDGIAFDDFTIAPPPSVDLGPDRVFCHGDTLFAEVENVSFSWSNGSQESYILLENLSDLPIEDSMLILSIEDTYELIYSDSIVFSLYPELEVQLDTTLDLKCHGDESGQIHINVIGGKAPYTFNWSDQSSTEDLVGVPAGGYSLELVDIVGCETSLGEVLIQEPTPLNLLTEVNHISCFGEQDGSILLDLGGGVPPYEYGWAQPMDGNFLDSLPEGRYELVISDSNGCEIDTAFYINQPDSLVAQFGGTVDASCFGTTDGAIELDITGGSAPYQILVMDSTNQYPFDQLGEGQYLYYVVDSSGCQTEFDSVEILSLGISPEAGFEVIVDDPEILIQDSSSGAETITWDLGDQTGLSYDSLSSYIYTENGIYTITQIVTNACGSDTAEIQIEILTVSIENELENSISIYPNPASNQLRIHGTLNLEKIDILDHTGKCIWSEEQRTTGEKVIQLSPEWAEGIYIIVCYTSKMIYSEKILLKR